MPLDEMQRALASLFTSEPERERMAREPDAFARDYGLDARELGDLRALGARRLQAYAGTLDRKRANEAAASFPLSVAARGPAFRAAFLAFARRVPLPATHRRYRDDAVAFARDVRRRGLAPGATLSEELALFEADTIAIFAARLPLAWRRFRYPVVDAARAPHAPVVERSSLVVWSGFLVRTIRQF